MEFIIILLVIAAFVAVYYFASDENIGLIDIVLLVLIIIAIIFACSKNETLMSIGFSSICLLPILGYIVNKKCGFLANGCKECGRKDSWHEKVVGRDVLDRVYKGQDKNGNAVYHEVADVYYHGKCDNCGYENDFVKRQSYNSTY